MSMFSAVMPGPKVLELKVFQSVWSGLPPLRTLFLCNMSKGGAGVRVLDMWPGTQAIDCVVLHTLQQLLTPLVPT